MDVEYFFKIPEFFFRSIANEEKINIAKNFAIGMFFLNVDANKRKSSIKIIEKLYRRADFHWQDGEMYQLTKAFVEKML